MTRKITDVLEADDGCRIEYQHRGVSAVEWVELPKGATLPPLAIVRKSHTYAKTSHTGSHCSGCGAPLPWAEDEA